MRTSFSAKRSSVLLLRVFTLCFMGVAYYGVHSLSQVSDAYDDVLGTLATEPVVVQTADPGGFNIDIPSYELFKEGGLWALVSKARPLDGEARYDLTDVTVPHGDQARPMKIATVMRDELEQLVNAAEADSELLMVSSAYRSRSDQKAIFDDFVSENGLTLAQQYVSPPGASEHQTGMSVDFSSVSDDCAEDSDTCSLSQSGAAWLASNAYRFGFIQRYPEGKSSVTGIAFEPWHFRFVGKPLAKAMNGSGLTLDEVVEQLAPGYALSRSDDDAGR